MSERATQYNVSCRVRDNINRSSIPAAESQSERIRKGRMSIQLWDEWLREAEKNIETYMWIVMGISSLCFAGIIFSVSF